MVPDPPANNSPNPLRPNDSRLLQARLEELEQIYQYSPMGLCVLDRDLRYVRINHRLAEVHGIPSEHHLGRTIMDILPDLAPTLEPLLRRVLDNGEGIINREIIRTVTTDEGKFRVWHKHILPLKNAEGHIFGINMGVEDVTARYHIQQALQESERTSQRRLAELLSLYNSTPIGMCFLDTQLRFVKINESLARMHGLSAEAHIGRSIRELFPLLADQVQPYFHQILNNGKPVKNVEISTETPAQPGTERVWLANYYPVLAQHGQLYGVNATVEDITDRKRAETTIAKQNVALGKKVRQRTEDLLVHRDRLRKLASDLTLLEQRERHRLATDLHDYLGQLLVVSRMKIQQALPSAEEKSPVPVLQELDQLLEQCMKYTRTLVAELSPQVLYDFGLPEALKWLGHQMRQHQLKVDVQIETGVPSIEEDQAVLLFQTVRELLFNVIKHAETDSARVSLKAKHNKKNIEVIVKDRGRGFTPSPSGWSSTSHETFGLLSIQERIEAMDGRLVLQSTPGKGTTVIATVPLHPALVSNMRREPAGSSYSERGSQTAAKTSSKISVLLADDHTMVRDGLKSILAGYGNIQVVGEAANGQEAIELTRCHQPDIVVMDVNMPIVNGVKATEYISRDFPASKVIALSINDDPETIASMRQAGAVAYLNKGSAATQLYQEIYAVHEPST